MKKLLLILFLILIISCDDPAGLDSNPKIFDQSHGVIKPLAVGNYWRYHFQEIKSPSDITFVPELAFYKVEQEILNEDELWFLIQNDNGQTIERNFRDGLYQNINGKLRLVAKYPCQKGEKWTFEHSSSLVNIVNTISNEFVENTYNVRLEILETKLEIEVNDVEYDCIQISELHDIPESLISDSKLEYINYYKPGIGLIKSERYKIFNNERTLTAVKELIEYKINKEKI